MYLIGVDQPWLQSPFLLNRRSIRSQDDIARLKAYGIQHVTIDPRRGLDYIAADQEPVPGPVALESTPDTAAAAPPGSPEVPLVAEPARGQPGPEVDLRLARAVHTEAVAAVQGLFEGVKTGAPINSGAAKEVVHSLLETVLYRQEAMTGLIHMRHFDVNLYAHTINVCAFALLLGATAGLERAQLECLGLGALLHDIGQVYLPRNLVSKPSRYTPQEQRLMQAHPQLGATMLSQAAPIPALACQIVAEHHERLDGSGYPRALRGADLAPMGQIVAIADVYESMLGPREARPALLPAQALKELYQQGRAQQLDLRLVEQLVRCLGLYPVGSLVALNTGERGIVTAVNPTDALRPAVTVLWDAALQRYARPRVLHLSGTENAEPYVICQVLDPVAEGYDLVTTLAESTHA